MIRIVLNQQARSGTSGIELEAVCGFDGASNEFVRVRFVVHESIDAHLEGDKQSPDDHETMLADGIE
jgi:hypothetical protein